MPNNGELIAKLSKQLTQRELYELASECRTIEEFLEKLKAIIESDK